MVVGKPTKKREKIPTVILFTELKSINTSSLYPHTEHQVFSEYYGVLLALEIVSTNGFKVGTNFIPYYDPNRHFLQQCKTYGSRVHLFGKQEWS